MKVYKCLAVCAVLFLNTVPFFAQTVHELPSNEFAPPTETRNILAYYTALPNPVKSSVISSINNVIDNYLTSAYETDYNGDLSVYYARRVKAHIQYFLAL